MSTSVLKRALPLAAALLVWAIPAAAQTGSISGRVTDAANGQAVPGAHVQAKGPAGASASAVTDSTGTYRLTGLAAGTYTLDISAVGYGARSLPGIRVVEGQASLAGASLEATAFALNPVVVTASKTQEKALDAPATVDVVTPEAISIQPTVSLTDHIRGLAGLDVASGGLLEANIVARGFNDVFSGSMLVLTDNRIASVPSLRVNVPYLIPLSDQDIERIEVVLGPGAALYGPNSANGVMNIITKSPFDSQGTTVSLSGGQRSVLQGTFRNAGVFSKNFGYKISGTYMQGTDWKHVDPTEIKPRDFNVEREAAEARVDYRSDDANTTATLTVGGTQAGRAIELTGIGAAQADHWRYTYYQARFHHDKLFAQAFLNASNAGNTYLLRTGNHIVDKSRLFVAQVQDGLDLGSRQSFLYGLDYQYTNPRTNGTIDGRNENRDNYYEVGGYLHSVTHLSPKFDLVAAARLDKHSRLNNAVFSPRVALVFKPTQGQNFRLTYNRAFSTPTSNDLFLDLIAGNLGGLYNVRTLGVPESGFQFRRNCSGSLCMRSPFSPDPTAYAPVAGAAAYWPAVVQILMQQGVDLSQIPAPSPSDVGAVLRVLNPTTETFSPVQASDVRDIAPLKPTITNTFEVGYKGLIQNRLVVAADAYYEQKTDFIGPLNVETPSVFLDPTQLAAYLGHYMSPPQAQALAAAIGGIPNSTLAPGIPLGVVSPDNPLTQQPDIVLTYRNFGNLHLWGADLSFEALLGDRWALNGSYSYMSKDFFPKSEIGGVSDIALNAPPDKGSLGLTYRNDPSGFNAEVRVRSQSGFPMNSGVYIGNVKAYTLFDAVLAYRLPALRGLQLSISATNLFNDVHQEFIGAPAIGRLVLTRLEYSF